MPDEISEADQPQVPYNGRNLRWREKLLTLNRIVRTMKPAEKLEVDTDIADFLGTPTQGARRSSTSAENDGLRTPATPLPHTQKIAGAGRRRREGRPPLQVRFTNDEPEIIGEGGDEAMLPSEEVTRSWLAVEKTAQPNEVTSRSSGASHEAYRRTPTPPSSGSEPPARHKDDELWIPTVNSEVEPRFQANKNASSHQLPVDTYASTSRRPSPLQESSTPSVTVLPDRQPYPLQTANIVGASSTSYTELISPYPNDPQEVPSNLENGYQSENTPEKITSSEELDEFYSRVEHLRSIFRLAADTSRQAPASFSEWLTAAKWWFIRGRSGIERATHAIGQNIEALEEIQNGNIPLPLKQSFVDLAKAWWIVKEIISELNQSIQSSDRQHSPLSEEHDSLLVSMRAWSKSLGKSHILPPYPFLAQGADTTVWIHYTALAPNLVYLLSGIDPKRVPHHNEGGIETDLRIPITDTKHYFSYGRMFVDMEVQSSGQPPISRFPCLLSIIRSRADYEVEVVLASQDSGIRLHVQPEKRKGVTWNEVHWKIKSNSLLIRLTSEAEITVYMAEHDFKNLWGIYDYASRLAMNWKAQNDEDMTFDDVSKLFHNVTSSQTVSDFPTRPLRQCRIRLFCRRTSSLDATGPRASNNGHRLVIMTPPSTKTLSSINQVIGLSAPIFFDYLRGEDDAPALLLLLSSVSKGTKSTMVLTFDQVSTRAKLHSQLDGSFVASCETASKEIILREFVTSPLLPAQSPNQENVKFPEGIKWQYVQVIKARTDSKKAVGVLSSCVRVCIHASCGNVTERICFGKLYSFWINRVKN